MSWQALAEVILVTIITTIQLGAASRALSTAKTRATRAHLGGNCGLLLCRCHLHDRKLVPEATITTNPVTDLEFATVTICPLPKESQTQQLAICYGRVCKKSKEIL